MLASLVVVAVVGLALSAVSWLAGRILHEATHLVACIALGARVRSVSLSHVEYVAPSHRADAAIKAAPAAAFWAMLLVLLVIIAADGLHAGNVFAGVFLVAYAPFSPEDRRGLRQFVPSYSAE